jgi:hypothetical protein
MFTWQRIPAGHRVQLPSGVMLLPGALARLKCPPPLVQGAVVMDNPQRRAYWRARLELHEQRGGEIETD